MSKKLVIFCDGTWNEPTKHRTNVLRMLQATESEDGKRNPQLVHYIAGVGTRKGEKLSGGTFGLGISNNIIDAYSFIVSNYEGEDEIFLFGFSRGAFTARSIAGLIHNLGVLKRCNLPLVAEAYKHYKNKTLDWKPKGKEADKWRQNCHSWPTKIKFLGLWDTVGALGAPYGEILGYVVDKFFKCGFHNVELSESVDSAWHALAADERRWVFRPTPIQLTEYHNERNRANKAKKGGFQFYEQKWFPGVHSNVGGGYDRHGLSDCALKWIADGAIKNGLNLKPLDQVQFGTGRDYKIDLTQPVEKKPQFLYQALTTLMVKLPGLIGLATVYPRADRPLAKHITWGGNYIRPIGPDEDVSVLKEKTAVDPEYEPSNVL